MDIRNACTHAAGSLLPCNMPFDVLQSLCTLRQRGDMCTSASIVSSLLGSTLHTAAHNHRARTIREETQLPSRQP